MELIGKSNFLQEDCVSFLLQRLLDTMYRFPEDKAYIFECISSIGLRHAHLTVDIVSDIYKVHPYLQRKEEKIDDPFCKLFHFQCLKIVVYRFDKADSGFKRCFEIRSCTSFVARVCSEALQIFEISHAASRRSYSGV